MPGIKAVACQSLIAAVAIVGGVVALANRAAADPLPTCTLLPAKLLGGHITYANAQIVPANTAPAPQYNNFTGTPPSSKKVPVTYCLVVLSYSSTPANSPTPQNITIYIGLPLNSTDGGVAGSTVYPPFHFTTVEGNWNGRTEGQGGGGCTGNNFVNSTGAVTNGFVGSGTDGGHGSPTNDPGNTCQEGVLSPGHLNYQYIQDWVYNGPQQEILWSKRVANLYYGKAPLYNYWNGCSTGGHQGYALAQTLAGELDGILANAPAMYWTRFQTAQMWGQIAMYDIAKGVIAAGKLAAVQKRGDQRVRQKRRCARRDYRRPADLHVQCKRQCLWSVGRAGGSELSDPNGSRCGQCHVGWPAQRFRQENMVLDRSWHRLPVLGWKRAVCARPGAVWMGSGKSALLQRRRFPDSLSWLLGKRRAEFDGIGSRCRDNLRGRRASWVG
jgi:hypothetical protein